MRSDSEAPLASNPALVYGLLPRGKGAQCACLGRALHLPTDDMIDAYIELKQAEIDRLRMTTHPVEFDMYYSC